MTETKLCIFLFGLILLLTCIKGAVDKSEKIDLTESLDVWMYGPTSTACIIL